MNHYPTNTNEKAPTEESLEDIEEETEDESGFQLHSREGEKTAWDYYGDINEHQIGLWNALTNEEHGMPSIEEDSNSRSHQTNESFLEEHMYCIGINGT